MTSKEVPSAICCEVPRTSTMKGTMMIPPPTPNRAETTPTKTPKTTTPSATPRVMPTRGPRPHDHQGSEGHLEDPLSRAGHDAHADGGSRYHTCRQQPGKPEVDFTGDGKRCGSDHPDRQYGCQRGGVSFVLGVAGHQHEQRNHHDSPADPQESGEETGNEAGDGEEGALVARQPMQGRARSAQGRGTDPVHLEATGRRWLQGVRFGNRPPEG
jgi:hypothetical protein